jgi:hypothetical protein
MFKVTIEMDTVTFLLVLLTLTTVLISAIR